MPKNFAHPSLTQNQLGFLWSKTGQHSKTKYRPSKDLPWITTELKHKIRQKNRWYKKTKETKSTKVWSKYKRLQACQKEVKNFKAMNDAYWNFINQVLSPKMEEDPIFFFFFFFLAFH